MTALSPTAANVNPGAGAKLVQKTAGGNLTGGLVVREDSTDSFQLTAAANTSAANANALGVLVQSAVDDEQPALVQTEGTVNGMGATEGVTYVLGAAGAIEPIADATTNDYVTVIGVGNSAGGIDLAIKATGSQVQ